MFIVRVIGSVIFCLVIREYYSTIVDVTDVCVFWTTIYNLSDMPETEHMPSWVLRKKDKVDLIKTNTKRKYLKLNQTNRNMFGSISGRLEQINQTKTADFPRRHEALFILYSDICRIRTFILVSHKSLYSVKLPKW